MTVPIGRKVQVYAKKEAVYGVEETLAATDANRHIECVPKGQKFNRVTSPVKKQSPGPATRFDREKTAELSTFVSLLFPSGVLNTLPDIDPILEAAFGKLTNVTLSTTVSASPSPTTTGVTVASAGTLAVGDAALISVTGQSASPFVRILTGVSGAALSWGPALPAAPTAGDAVKGGITYQLTTDLAIALTLAKYVPNGRHRELLGLGINQFTLGLDPNEEPRVTVAGPAKDMLSKSNVQTQPVGFTTAGTQPPSGLVGELFLGDALYKFTNAEITIANGLALRTQEYGVNGATALYRSGRREIGINLESFTDDDALHDLTEAGTYVSFLKQTGKTEGNIVAVYAPKVDFMNPEEDDPEEEITWAFAGTAIETVDGANDELVLALM